MSPEEEIVRAERARQVLDDPLVRAALNDIRATIIAQWYRSAVKDTELRDYLWSLYVAAVKFEEVLRSHMETGQLASAQLELEQRAVSGGHAPYPYHDR